MKQSSSNSKENQNGEAMAPSVVDECNEREEETKVNRSRILSLKTEKNDKDNQWMISIPYPEADIINGSLLKVKEEKLVEDSSNSGSVSKRKGLRQGGHNETTQPSLAVIAISNDKDKTKRSSSKSVSVAKKSAAQTAEATSSGQDKVAEEPFVKRRSRRQSVCLEKLNDESPRRKSISDERIVLKIARRQSISVQKSDDQTCEDQFEIIKPQEIKTSQFPSENDPVKPSNNKRPTDSSLGSGDRDEKRNSGIPVWVAEPEIIEAKSSRQDNCKNHAEDKQSVAVRRSQRKSVYVEKLNYEPPLPKLHSNKILTSHQEKAVISEGSLFKLKELKVVEAAESPLQETDPPNPGSVSARQGLSQDDDHNVPLPLTATIVSNDENEPQIIEAKSSEPNPSDKKNGAEDKKSFAIRKSRRQSVCVEKLNYEPSRSKSNSDKETNGTRKPSSSTERELDSKGAQPIILKIARRQSIFDQQDDEESCEDQFEIVKPLEVEPSENDPVTPSKNKKRPRESSVGSSSKTKHRKFINSSAAQPSEPNVIEEVIEDIWHVSVMAVQKEHVARFLVKWDGFDPSENTYEPYEHVSHVTVLKDYVRRKFGIHQSRIDSAIRKLLMDSGNLHEKYKGKPKSFILEKLSNFDELRFKCNILAFIYTYEKIPHFSVFMRNLRYHNVLNKFHEKVKKEKAVNKTLVNSIMMKENKLFKVTIENLIDYDPIPPFKYLKSVKSPLKRQSNLGCECKNGCSKNTNCCPKLMGLEFVYDVDKRLFAMSHQMIIECNDFCTCDSKCPNRKRRTEISLCVFKTQDRGWALKTMENIPIGAFVIEYTGELIDQYEAKTRSRLYNKTVNNYLFDLDYNDTGKTTYSIDATYKGNLSRFINHSCEANLQTWPAMTCNESGEMHRLYYFSLRQIKAGEELTVDYSGGVLNSNNVPSKHAIACKCGSMLCKGFLF